MNLNELQDFTKKMVNYQRFYKKEDSLEGMKYYVGLFNELAARVLAADNSTSEVKNEEKTPGTVTPTFSQRKVNTGVVTAFKDLGNSFQLITEEVEKMDKPTHRINWKGKSKTDGFTIWDKQMKKASWQTQRKEKIQQLYDEAVMKGQEITPDIIQRIAQIVGTTSPCVKRIINEYTFSKI